MSLGSIESRVYVLRAIGFTNFLLVLADLLNRFAQIGWPWASFVQTGAFCGEGINRAGAKSEQLMAGAFVRPARPNEPVRRHWKRGTSHSKW